MCDLSKKSTSSASWKREDAANLFNPSWSVASPPPSTYEQFLRSERNRCYTQTCANLYKQRLNYELTSKIRPSLSKKIRIVGGDVVPGVGIVQRTHPFQEFGPSSSPYDYSQQRERLSTPPPREYYPQAITYTWRPISYRKNTTVPSGMNDYRNFRLERSRSPSISCPLIDRDFVKPREKRTNPPRFYSRSKTTSRLMPTSYQY